jgi:aminoglycoside phosphotransferase (APT) family kinase protein
MLGRHRDLDAVRAGLAAWLRRRWPSADALEVATPVAPKAGLSNETFLVDAAWREAGRRHAATLVVRLAPTDFLVFPEYDLGRQAEIMTRLGGSDVPVPRVIAFEPDPSPLGTPFYVMEKIDGVIPPEVPPYHAAGLCVEATPAERAALWWAGIEALVRVHAVDWRARGLATLGAPGPGTDPLDRQLAWWARYLDWVRGDRPQPVLAAALAWLRDHRYVPERVALCWGDARLPNLVFRDGRVVGVLDWEMAFLGDPAADLGWWLFLDRANSEGYGIPRLAGFPDAGETVARYEALAGHAAGELRWQEVFAAFRFGVIMARIADRLQAIGAPTPTDDFFTDNVCTQSLARLLGLPPPGRPRAETRIDTITARVQFHLTGPGGGDWYVVAAAGAVRRHDGCTADADATVTVSAADWDALRSGRLDRAEAFLGGRVRVTGDVTLLMQLEDAIARLEPG